MQVLRDYVKRDMDLQTQDLTSVLDQKQILAKAKTKYGVKRLAGSYIPGSRANKETGEHLFACPCAVCVELEKTLNDGDRKMLRKVRGLRNWIPQGKRRPRCLMLPAAVPSTGMQQGPYYFCGREDIMHQLEEAFAAGSFLHPRIFHGEGVNTTPNLSSGWIGGAATPSASATSAGDSSFKIPKDLPKAHSFVRDGPRGWGRFTLKETCTRQDQYFATMEAMSKARDLLSLGKQSLEKRVKDWSTKNLSLPDEQYDQIKLPALPARFDKVVKMDGPSKVKESALRAVGIPLNYAVSGGIRLSECVAQMDELVPDFEVHLAALASLKPPIYVAPTELKDLQDVKASAQVGQRVLADPEAGSDPSSHWLRSKGEGLLESSSVLKDIFIKGVEDPDSQVVPDVPRDAYLEVCWRAALMREQIKKARSYADTVEALTKQALDSVSKLATEIRSLQDVFAHQLYPSLGWIRATIMFQRMDHLRSMLTPEFREFVKKKAAKDPLPDGSERSVMQYLVDDPEAVCAEFSEHMKSKPRDHDILRSSTRNEGGGKGKGKSGKGAKTKAKGGRHPAAPKRRQRSRSPHPRAGGGRSARRDDRRSSRSPRKRRQEDRDDSSATRESGHANKKPRREDDDNDKGAKGRRGGYSRNNGKGSSGSKKKKGESLACYSFPPSEIVSQLGFDVMDLSRVLSLQEAGRTQQCLSAWKVITNSVWVLKTIEFGVTWSWKVGPPSKSFKARRNPEGDQNVLRSEFEELRRKGALVTRNELPFPEDISYVVSYFSVPKKDKDKHRPITNLKPLNKRIANSKFKMETVKSVRKWLVKDAFMVSLDLSDAYLSLAMARDRWQFMGIEWEGIEYFFKALCFGLNVGPRIFTKCLKKVIQFFRRVLLIWVSFYLDDLLVQDPDPKKLRVNAEVMILILQLLGFRVNLDKSDVVPSQQITHLGFVFNTVDMTVSLPLDKVAKIRGMVSSTLSRGTATVKQLQQLMGTLESTRPAVRIAPLHYRKVQGLLVKATKKDWPMNKVLSLSDSVKEELSWWVSSLESFRSSPMRDPPVDISIWSDAATSEGCGWGGYTSLGASAQGVWTDKERELHINVLETLGAVNVVEALLPPNKTAAHFIDNTTAVAYVRNFGGTKSTGSCERALKYWDIVLDRNCWVIPSHIAGKDNIMADYFSRHTVDHHEYGLTREAFARVVDHLFMPKFDLFASEELHVVDEWASFCWTKGSKTGDAFLLKDWPDKAYIFPPVPLLNEVVARLARQDQDFIFIAPLAPDGAGPMWLPILKTLISEEPLILGRAKEVCRLKTGKTPDLPGYLAAFSRSRSSRKL